MKKSFFTAVTVMAVASAMRANQIIESVAAYFGTHEQCKSIIDGVDSNSQDPAAIEAYNNYTSCRNSTVLEEMIIGDPK